MKKKFSSAILIWFDKHGRHDLPWQQQVTPYRVWVSEIMLQQTQVATVIPYFQRFMQRFPDLHALATTPIDEVLHLWTGLGYYARARNLHRCAQILVNEYQSQFPASVAELSALPGIGRSTAGAILALGMGRHASILDGNVKRVLCRFHAIEGWPDQRATQNQLWALAEEATPVERCADYTQAVMDLGATICTRSKPLCLVCPLAGDCRALLQQRVKEFPQRKPKRAIPVRSTNMLMCVLGTEQPAVLLEKRPASGIWGGLWSFPEASAVTNATDNPMDSNSAQNFLNHLQAGRCGYRTNGFTEWPSVRHTFSHFHLDIRPLRIDIDPAAIGLMDSARWLWYPLDHSVAVGLAAPVKKLLDQLSDSKSSKAAS